MSIYNHIFGTTRMVSEYAKKHLYYCDRAGYITESRDFIIDRDFMDNYLILYVVSGYFHLDINGKKSTAVSGDTVIVNLKGKHLYYSDKQEPCEILWMDINCVDDKITLLMELTCLPLIFPCKDNFEPMNEFVHQYVNNATYGEIKQSQVIYMLLLSAVSWIKNTTEYELSPFPEVENYISSHIGRRIVLSQLADTVHLSKYHFLHMFKKKYGMSPMTYVMSKKIERAVYLMTYGNLTVTQISEQLGFSSQSHFSAQYKKHTGYYPTEHKKMNPDI